MVTETEITVVLADDHELLRDGIKSLLKKFQRINLLGEASNGKELCEIVGKLKPDVVVTDIKMPEMDGIQATKWIKKNYPATVVLALSMFDEEHTIVDMLEAGASGYLIKNVSKKHLIEAIETVNQGKNYYCQTTSQKLCHLIRESKFNPHLNKAKLYLSKRELEVMKLICKEFTNKQIGQLLNISPRTVENHRESLHEKIGVKNSVGIALYAMKHGLV